MPLPCVFTLQTPQKLTLLPEPITAFSMIGSVGPNGLYADTPTATH